QPARAPPGCRADHDQPDAVVNEQQPGGHARWAVRCRLHVIGGMGLPRWRWVVTWGGPVDAGGIGWSTKQIGAGRQGWEGWHPEGHVLATVRCAVTHRHGLADQHDD